MRIRLKPHEAIALGFEVKSKENYKVGFPKYSNITIR